ncbi:phosphoribosyltransferase family protein [Heyndrickxia sp. NPDC080065]|uniref:ComF family protein n=1 Tax=Heyndrickxia sp. NPDC080065 TaxID=3390568 RepID=UPI003D02DB72
MGNQCHYCHIPIHFELTWKSIIIQPSPKYLCDDCNKKLHPIKGLTCQTCSRSLEKLSSEYIKDNICLDCHRWEADPEWSGILEKNISLYEYNEFLKELIARFKFRGDYVLAKIFSQKIKNTLSSMTYDVIIPIPLSKERQQERGFNQAIALAHEAELQTAAILTRIHSEKQSKKSRQERIHIDQVFHLKDDTSMKGKNIILFDDIYTTGSTLRHAAKQLKIAGASTVKAITIARG